MDMPPPRPPSLPHAALLRTTAGLAAALCFPMEAGAVFTYASAGQPRQVTLRVGSANSAINNVSFNVVNANVSPTPAPVTGTPGAGTPLTSPANGTEIQVVWRVPNNEIRSILLTVDSSTPLMCVSGGCGATVIPFTTISWTSYNKQTGADAGKDIQDGTFTGGANQLLGGQINTTTPGPGQEATLTNVLIFRYSNATLYPSGQYTGRVTFTAFNL